MGAIARVAMPDARHKVVYAAEAPALDTPVQVVPGIFWLRLALPFALDHINLWLIDEDDGWTLVDSGLGDLRTRAVFERLWPRWLEPKPLRRVLVTHFHPDHLGLAGWLTERSGAPLLMSRTEWLMGRMLALDDSTAFRDAGEVYDRRAGLAPELIDLRRERGNLYRRNVTLPPASFEVLADGQELRLGGAAFRVIVGKGHAPEQVTLHSAERNLLIAADQLLPKITPVVGVWPTSVEADPLGDFLACLDRYRHLPEDVLVLPSHGQPYRGLHARLDQLAAHHEDRLRAAHELCRAPVTVARVMHRLFPRAAADPSQVGFAIAETLAHLRALQFRGAVTPHQDPDGTERWQAA